MSRRSYQFVFKLPLLAFIFSAVLFSGQKSEAAACCGGGFAAPSLISGDDKAQVTTSYSFSEIKSDVYSDGLWRKRNYDESSETIKIETAHIFWDRWQAGLSLPVVKRSRSGGSSTGLGDVAATLGYEYLPDWDYNPWRPKGLGYLQLTAPTGRSIYEADGDFQLDARGRGFWAMGAGTLLTKIIEHWDVFTNLDIHRSFAKRYSGPMGQSTLQPGWGGNLSLGGGYNWTRVRAGSSITWTYEDPIDLEGPSPSQGSPERFATAAVAVSYLYSDEWAATLNYSDQTLFGNPVNARLGQAVMLQVQRRWSR